MALGARALRRGDAADCAAGCRRRGADREAGGCGGAAAVWSQLQGRIWQGEVLSDAGSNEDL